ncbi:baseplate multidomain protein megatron [Henriciella mobilis]|uniref:Host specificity protein n=1 Tax=Henriciella mobilis TaxID=2305467 RepID=A0A399RCS7_9PROT|nr:glycoside hydrolase/phage tail family protein [Henriciella mobilis]RIJ28493.1 hypothetical protein D1223_14030 [Henriciella mobilis]
MGQIILSQVGATLGASLLPSSVGLGGLGVSGAAIGAIAGTIAGRAIDSALAPTLEGPRIEAFHVMNAREGAGMANVYGRMRVGGQLIWASRFKECRRERSAGKGGPKISDYSYSVSLAVAVCEGPVTRLDRVWANGEILRLADYHWRFYAGGETQEPDPLIEAVEGTGEVPAFRGTAYVVFEDLPLDAFGNRLPQFSFEVVRAASADEGLCALAHGVNIIPATGEFVYGIDIVRERYFPGTERALNMNNDAGEADFRRSLDQLLSDLPGLEAATLTVGWFGDDLRAGSCRIRPGVETRERSTVPYQWSAAGQTRAGAHLVSQSGTSANYGGTPSDTAVLQAIAALQAEGVEVTLSPFLLMDVPPGNGLSDPYGGAEQAAFPWRGRITEAADKTAAVRTAVEAFLGTDNDFGYRHFILHHARLAAQAGGVEAILIGSEMRGLTRLRDETGAFPFVEGLIQLASDVRAIVGPDVKVSYAADWTEYGSYVPGDGSGDVLFPLDALWSSSDIDFVGVDWYPPAGDWRDGETHLDRAAGYTAADDPSYLADQMAGGEAYDWYYASQADRDSQVRTPITDTAHGEHWVFRQKDLAGWWNAAHHERPGGVRSASPTGWSPGMKPVRLIEIGFPAVDKGGNAPNLFYDPKSSESALPPYSTGERDDVFQRRALEAALAFWQAQPFVDQVYVWAWDARPWPDFPVRESVWSDGPNWAYGHWLNGRTSLISLAETVTDLCARAGVSVDASQLGGLVEGVVTTGPASLRRILEPFRVTDGLGMFERADGLVCVDGSSISQVNVNTDRLVEPGLTHTRPLLDKRPGRLQLSYISADGLYAPRVSDARSDLGDTAFSIEAELPLVLSDAAATRLAAQMLDDLQAADTAHIALPVEALALEPGDAVQLDGLPGDWAASDVTDDGLVRHVSLVRAPSSGPVRSRALPGEPRPAPHPAQPELILIDGPALSGAIPSGPVIAVGADPWRGPVTIHAGATANSLIPRAAVSGPASIATLADPLAAGPAGRWDRAGTLTLNISDADLMSRDRLDVLAVSNRILVQNGAGWELIGYESASLIADGVWQLSGLLRGLEGSVISPADAGAVCVIVDRALATADMLPGETGRELVWRAGQGEAIAFTYEDRGGLPWSVAHLRATPTPGGALLSWIPRGIDIPDSWDRPDPSRQRRYRVEALLSGVVGHSQAVDQASAAVPAGHNSARVAEIGTDGRIGHWVSIALGAS